MPPPTVSPASLELALRHRFKLLGFVGLLILLAAYLAPRIGREFFPQVDAGQITMFLRCPSNSRLDASEKRVEQVEELIRQNIPQDELEMILGEMGVDSDWSSAYTENSGQQDTIIRVQLTDKRRFMPRNMLPSSALPSKTIPLWRTFGLALIPGG